MGYVAGRNRDRVENAIQARRLPEPLRLQARSLYVVHGRQPLEIAQLLQLTPDQVYRLISREGWNKIRASRKAARDAAQDARAREDIEKVQEVIAIRSEELTVRSLDLCSEFLDTKDAKNLSMASSAARNLSEISRKSRGLDAQRGNENGNSFQFNVFQIRGERVEKTLTAAVTEIAPAAAAPSETTPKAM